VIHTRVPERWGSHEEALYKSTFTYLANGYSQLTQSNVKFNVRKEYYINKAIQNAQKSKYPYLQKQIRLYFFVLYATAEGHLPERNNSHKELFTCGSDNHIWLAKTKIRLLREQCNLIFKQRAVSIISILFTLQFWHQSDKESEKS